MRKSLAKKQPQIHALIAIGIYQLSRMRIKEHAAINETVKVCDELKRSWAKGLVNGILREFQRSKFKASSLKMKTWLSIQVTLLG